MLTRILLSAVGAAVAMSAALTVTKPAASPSEARADSGAIDQIMETPLWLLLPAVQDGSVHIVDRLGHPGIEGHIRAIEDLVTMLSSSSADSTNGPASTEDSTS